MNWRVKQADFLKPFHCFSFCWHECRIFQLHAMATYQRQRERQRQRKPFQLVNETWNFERCCSCSCSCLCSRGNIKHTRSPETAFRLHSSNRISKSIYALGNYLCHCIYMHGACDLTGCVGGAEGNGVERAVFKHNVRVQNKQGKMENWRKWRNWRENERGEWEWEEQELSGAKWRENGANW